MNWDKWEQLLIDIESSTEEEREWIVMQFSLNNQSEKIQKAIWVAMLFDFFDYNLLNYLLDNELSSDEFQELTRLSYIEPYGELFFNVHERTKKILSCKISEELKKHTIFLFEKYKVENNSTYNY